MKNKDIKNTIYGESLLESVTTTYVPITEPAVNDSDPEIKQDLTETGANGQVKSEERERVYLHSIGRFNKLKKLQKGTYND